jgi:hypothetical protein
MQERQPNLARLKLQILNALWPLGKASIREIQETFLEPRPAYTTVQTKSTGSNRKVRCVACG